jgi:hypothetical protein
LLLFSRINIYGLLSRTIYRPAGILILTQYIGSDKGSVALNTPAEYLRYKLECYTAPPCEPGPLHACCPRIKLQTQPFKI